MRTGKQAPQLVDVLFGSCRQHILALLLLRPGESFYVREIARLTGVPAGSLHRELKLLTSAGLLERSTAGNQVRYQVDRKAPSTRSSPALSQDGWASRARQVPHDSRSSQPPALFRVPEIRGQDLWEALAEVAVGEKDKVQAARSYNTACSMSRVARP